jgi:NADH-ubiquinone oxidoreductase chain 1
VAQAISYEVRIFLILFLFTWFLNSFRLIKILYYQSLFIFSFWNLILIFVWLLICLAEANRTPFDFSEGESELVSGFNTEYGGGFFSLIFICEYGIILFFSYISSLIFLGGDMFLRLKAMIIGFFFVWTRGRYPRLRYDRLMLIAWKRILPFVLGLIIFLFNYSIF